MGRVRKSITHWVSVGNRTLSENLVSPVEFHCLGSDERFYVGIVKGNALRSRVVQEGRDLRGNLDKGSRTDRNSKKKL